MIVSIDFKDHVLEVHGEYHPAEKEVLYYPDGSGYPGCAAEFEIHDIMLGEYSLFEILWNDLEEIEELVIDKCSG